MSSVRAFLAVPIPRPTQERIATLQEKLGGESKDIRWSRPGSLHLTLHFFGDIDQESLEKIKVSMLSVKRCHRPFRVGIEGVGAFPSLRRPRVIWLGLHPQAQLIQLHRDLQTYLQREGLSPDERAKISSPSAKLNRLTYVTASFCQHTNELGKM